MKVYIDERNFGLITAPGVPNPVTTIRFKRARLDPLEVQFVSTDGAVVYRPAASMSFALKPKGVFDTEPVVLTLEWTLPDPEDANPVYRCNPVMNTTALNALFNIDENPANDVPSVTLMGEINWTPAGGPVQATQTFDVVIANDVYRSGDSDPEDIDVETYQALAEKDVNGGYAGRRSDGLITGQVYDLLLGFIGAPDAAEEDSVLVNRPIQLAGTGHTVVAESLPSTAATFEVYAGASKIGEVVVDAVATVTFTLTDSAPVAVSTLTRIRVVAPSPATDAADLQFYLRGSIVAE